MKPDSRVVYSTTDGDLGKARDPGLRERRAVGDRVKVRREVAGRRGRAVTTVSGVPVDDVGLKKLAGELKKRCGVGGFVKNGVIEIQGDHRDVVVQMLEAQGYRPVLAGGGCASISGCGRRGCSRRVRWRRKPSRAGGCRSMGWRSS